MRNTLKKHGVRELDPRGEKFDPNFHQAMYEVPDPEAAAGTVVEVMQTGYAIGDRVLRPALVAVAKVSEKPSAKQDGAKAPGPGAS
jgi:molecular chaperone GrpE